MFVSGWKQKTRKITIPSSFPAILGIASACQTRIQKEKKKKETQTKLSAPYVRYNVKILIIHDKWISQEHFERKVLEVVSRFSTEKSFKT